ncbi:ParB/RepB/Spo0J family partition protein [Piscirickettsia salmonis]|uniref:ParB/RepB/Spo0J family partition protein n=1 Tax=Piscirickettsia salmonis TaxID=1238 RepID=UPI0007C990A9|nr:Nucleoid occlusion protein [Piscirickettsiaceae bacterium NZ-RLO1]
MPSSTKSSGSKVIDRLLGQNDLSLSSKKSRALNKKNILEYDSFNKIDVGSSEVEAESYILVDPFKCINWGYSDRNNFDFGNQDGLELSIKENGQAVPAILRKHPDKPEYFEIISGERRWTAIKNLRKLNNSLMLKAIIIDVDDNEAALIQINENQYREGLSEYSKGINYSRLINNGVLTRKELEKNLEISKSAVGNLLSFADLPEDLIFSIKDMTKVNSKTSSSIRAFLNSGGSLEDLIQCSEIIRSGASWRKINEKITGDLVYQQSKKVVSSDGRHLFSWRKDPNGNLSVSFPNNIINNVNHSDLETLLSSGLKDLLNSKV